MCSLIAERPNLVPVGLGNNETPIDLSILLPNKSSENVEAFSDAGDEGGEGDEDRVSTTGKEREVQDIDAEAEWDASMAAGAASNAEGSEGVTNDEPDSDEEGEVLEVPAKRKSKNEVKEEVKPEGKKTAAHPGTSTPAAKREKKKAKTTTEKFSDIAHMEEESVQKELELKVIRAKGGSSVKIAKIEAQAKLQMEKEKTKAALAAKKMEHTFQLQMLELQQQSALFQQPFPTYQSAAGLSNLNTYHYSTNMAPQTHYAQHMQQFDFSHTSASTPDSTSSTTQGEYFLGMEEFKF